MEREWSRYRGGQFNGGRMVMLQRCLMEGAWSCYRGQYNGGRMLLTEVESLNEGEWSFYRGGQLNGGRMVMLQRWCLMEGA